MSASNCFYCKEICYDAGSHEHKIHAWLSSFLVSKLNFIEIIMPYEK